jgi:hypothetical protein
MACLEIALCRYWCVFGAIRTPRCHAATIAKAAAFGDGIDAPPKIAHYRRMTKFGARLIAGLKEALAWHRGEISLPVTEPNAETPSETARRILEKHGLAFPENRQPIPPEEFRKLWGEGDETDEPKPD